MVVVLPTKERVFATRVRAPHPRYRDLVDQEERIVTIVVTCLRDCGIEVIDVTSALAERLGGEAPPYPESSDGHTTASGHDAIAERVAASVR